MEWNNIYMGPLSHLAAAAVLLAVMAVGTSDVAVAGPSAEVAKRCVHFSYLAYPYKRPGSVRMSGDRQAYFRDCMTKEGNVPEPVSTKP